MIGKKAEQVLNRAVALAFNRKHEYFTLEHVLLSLLQDEQIAEMLVALGVDQTAIEKALDQYLEKEIPKSNRFFENQSAQELASDNEVIENPTPTLGVQRLIQRAIFHVQSAGKDRLDPADLLVALFQAKDSQALFVMKREGLKRLEVISYLADSQGELVESAEGGGAAAPVQAKSSGLETLLQYTVNLNELARAEKIDPLVGRKNELQRMIQVLCRRRKNNPILVGEAGVGKTALAEGLALRVVAGEVPELLANAEVLALDLANLLAGTKFRGDFEKRIQGVLSGIKIKKAQGLHPILFIDEIHTMVGAGSVGQGTMDAAHLLKPLLARGELHCIGTTTYNDYRLVFEKDHGLSRRFQKIDIVEPSVDEAVLILKGLKGQFEKFHQVVFSNEAIRTAVELSQKYISGRCLPDKAIDVIDEAGAKARLQGMNKIEASYIEEVIALMARVPSKQVSVSQKDRLQNLDRDLKLVIFGQDHAVDALVTSIRLARSGLRSGEKPVGSFLFCGPTGVGKTELAKQLSLSLAVPFIRFDMSEYAEKHTVSRLIGAPPGYVGFEQAGLLTDAINKNPHAVVLLDEIEKAHPDLWNILLQVMDHGGLTDNNGKKADFRQAIIILTTNVGAREHEKRGLGLAKLEVGVNARASQKELEQTFSPEFRNRLDATVYFNPLDGATIAQVVGKQLIELEEQLLARGVEIECSAEVRQWLGEAGYDKLLGARPLGRLIEEKIKKPLANEILFGKLEHGGRVRVERESGGGGELRFEFEPAEMAVVARGSERRNDGAAGSSGDDELIKNKKPRVKKKVAVVQEEEEEEV